MKIADKELSFMMLDMYSYVCVCVCVWVDNRKGWFSEGNRLTRITANSQTPTSSASNINANLSNQ